MRVHLLSAHEFEGLDAFIGSVLIGFELYLRGHNAEQLGPCDSFQRTT